MKDIIEGILKFLSELTPKRIVGLIVFLGLVMFSVNVYEYYTGAFECKRIERVVNLLEKLNTLERDGILSNQCLKAAYLESVERTEAVLDKKNNDFTRKAACTPTKTTHISWWKKGLASSWLWLFFAMCVIPGIIKGKAQDKSAFGGFLVLAALVWVVGGFIPGIWWPWFHAGVLVVLQLLLLIIIVLVSNRKK